MNNVSIFPCSLLNRLINLRKHVIAVVNLRSKFNLKPKENSPKTRIIICSVARFIVGLVVDSVSEVTQITNYNIEPTPEVVKQQIKNDYIKSIVKLGKRVVTYLDLEAVLSKEKS